MLREFALSIAEQLSYGQRKFGMEVGKRRPSSDISVRACGTFDCFSPCDNYTIITLVGRIFLITPVFTTAARQIDDKWINETTLNTTDQRGTRREFAANSPPFTDNYFFPRSWQIKVRSAASAAAILNPNFSITCLRGRPIGQTPRRPLCRRVDNCEAEIVNDERTSRRYRSTVLFLGEH